jgi:hypothetical protein
MKKTACFFLLLILLTNAALPCGLGFITPIFEYKYAPENPYENFAAGRIGVLKPTYRRVVLFAAYRYLNNGSFSAAEQKDLVDVWNAEFKNQGPSDDDVAAAVKAWVEKRKDVAGKEEKLPDIYTERDDGGYDFFPNCTKNAFETAIQTLSDRVASYGSDDKDVKAWLKGQDQVFANCASGVQMPDEPSDAMPEWLQKDRHYQIAAAAFYSLNYDEAKDRFKQIAEDQSSPWQETADYLVGRTLIRQASLTKDPQAENRFYTEAEQRLQTVSSKSAKFQASAQRLLGLVKYRLRPQERALELAQNLSFNGTQNLRQDLIDYTWLLDKFEKETLEAEEKRKEDAKSKTENPPVEFSTSPVPPVAGVTPGIPDPNSVKDDSSKNEGELEIYLYTDDYAQNWTVYVKPEWTDAETVAHAEKMIGRPLTAAMKERLLGSKKAAFAARFSNGRKPEYEGGYFGSEKTSLSVLPDFLRREDMTDWLFTFQIQSVEAYQYSLSRFKQNGSDLWLLTALSKADKNSTEVNKLLEAAKNVGFSAPAYPTVAYHRARLLLEQNKQAEARKLLDEVIDSAADLPVSSRTQFQAMRLKLADTLEDFLKFAQRKPFAFDWDGAQSGSIDYFIEQQKSWYNPEYETVSKEEYDRNVEEQYKEEKKWQDRLMFDSQTVEIINEHFPLAVLLEAQKSASLPDYLKERLALSIWTRAAILEDFQTAARIAPEVIKAAPDTEPLMNKFLEAKTLQAKRQAALYLILKNTSLTPYISGGMGTPAEGYKMYATQWWCQPYEDDYDENTGEAAPHKTSTKPAFLTKLQSEAAQGELKKLKAIGDAPKYFGEKVLEWARLAPNDKRVPESLFIVYEANGWDKYGCGNNTELHEQIGNLLKKRYPLSDEAKQIVNEEKENN